MMAHRSLVIGSFLRACNVWVVFALLMQLPDTFVLWTFPPAADLMGSSWVSVVLSPYAYLPKHALLLGNMLLLSGAIWNSLTVPTWWRMGIVWWLYGAWMSAAWPTSTGGHQLMANALLWGVPLSIGVDKERWPMASMVAFHVLRWQLVLAYVAGVAHKLTGDAWSDGTALTILAKDPAWNLTWLAQWPIVAMVLTWVILLFQIVFVIAIWWKPARRYFLILGLVFHIFTGHFFGIPEMGMAFVVCYLLWLQEAELKWFVGCIGRGNRLSARIDHGSTAEGSSS